MDLDHGVSLEAMKALEELGVDDGLLQRIEGATKGKVGKTELLGKVGLEINQGVDLVHADSKGTIQLNPARLEELAVTRFGSIEAGAPTVSKILEEELLHSIHQMCPGYVPAARLFAEAATQGDTAPLQAAATAFSLYERCNSGKSGKTSMAALATNPKLLEQGYGELLRMTAQYSCTGKTTEMMIKPWKAEQLDQLEKIGKAQIMAWHKEIESGNWGQRCRNQYRLMCAVLKEKV